MPLRKTTDQRPGPVPDIRAEGDSVMYVLAVAGVEREARLVIRCDPDGSVSVAIELA